MTFKAEVFFINNLIITFLKTILSNVLLTASHRNACIPHISLGKNYVTQGKWNILPTYKLIAVHAMK